MLKVLKGLEVLKVAKVLKVLRVTQVLKDHLARRVMVELQAHKVLKG